MRVPVAVRCTARGMDATAMSDGINHLDRSPAPEHPGQLFSYYQAFDRNIGWLTEWEQAALRGKRVAIAGMGGVGGGYLLSLARLGVGAFHIADFDRFELANFNRQAGAMMRTLGEPKARTLEEMAREINPELRIKRFDDGIGPETVDAFLESVDLFIDGLDFFVLQIRRRLFDRCTELGIPAITAAPIGMGSGFLAFTPDGMSFENYFRLEGHTEADQYVRFLMGVAPRGLHRSYLVDKSRVDLAGRKGPSTGASCQLCTGMVTVAATKILLRRGGVKPAPFHHHFDPYRDKYVVTRLRFGNAGPLQGLKVRLAQRLYAAMSRQAVVRTPPAPPASTIEEILNVARWAPSGDNAQPWRVRVLDAASIAVRIFDRSEQNLYEYRKSEPTLISAGMLLESIRIAATAWGLTARWDYANYRDRAHEIIVRFTTGERSVDPLYPFLTLRSVDRRPYRLKSLRQPEIAELERALHPGLLLQWHETLGSRWQFARLCALATGIRLRIPEAFPIHQQAIDWTHPHSPNGIPAATAGLDRLSLRMMKWGMRDWSRMRLLNRLGGVASAQLQLDYLPAIASAAFFTIGLPRTNDDDRIVALLRAGQAIDRFWLTATRLGLAIQPELAVLAFAHYGATAANFTTATPMRERAKVLASALRTALGSGYDELVFIGRIGRPKPRMPFVRSTRLTLDQLIENRGSGLAGAAVENGTPAGTPVG